MRVRSLVGGAIGDKPHGPGDVIEGDASQVEAWIEAGIAEPIAPPSKPTQRRSRPDETGAP